MGVVYKARDVKLNRLVALKMILHAGHAGTEEKERFEREARAVAGMQHPNIVQAFEINEHEGKPFLSLELVEGGTLADQLKLHPLPPKDAAKLVATLAEAVSVAHNRHIIHRDLKPSNILLTNDGIPKITDFGLAKDTQERGKTATGAVMGTPSYMAPEQAGGRIRTIGPATDVYALGAILYECITGHPPFKAPTSVETIFQVLNEVPIPPSRIVHAVSHDLATICMKCLQKEPKRRYQTAQELTDDLNRFVNNQPILARPVGPVEKLYLWGRRHPQQGGTLAGVLLLAIFALVGLGGISFFSVEENQDIVENLAMEKLANEASKQAIVLKSRIDELKQDTWYLAILPEVRQLTRARQDRIAFDSETGESVEEIRAKLREEFVAMLTLRPHYVQVRYLDPTGMEIFRAHRSRSGAKVSIVEKDRLAFKGKRDYFQETKKLLAHQVYLSAINLNRESEKVQTRGIPVLRSAMPLHQNGFAGIVIINMDFSALTNPLQSAANEKELRAYLTNSEGDFLEHPEAGKEYGFDRGKRYRIQETFPNPELIRWLSAKDSPLLASFSVREGETEATLQAVRIPFDSDRKERFLTLSLASSREQLLSGARTFRGRIQTGVVLTVLLMAVATALGGFLVQRWLQR